MKKSLIIAMTALTFCSTASASPRIIVQEVVRDGKSYYDVFDTKYNKTILRDSIHEIADLLAETFNNHPEKLEVGSVWSDARDHSKYFRGDHIRIVSTGETAVIYHDNANDLDSMWVQLDKNKDLRVVPNDDMIMIQ